MSLICNWCGIENSEINLKCENCGTELGRGNKKEFKKKEAGNTDKIKKNITISLFIFSFAGVIYLFFFKSDEVQINNNSNFQSTVLEDENSSLHQISHLEEEVKLNPTNSEVILKLANAQHDSKLFKEAIENYKKYLKLNPQNVDAIVDLGICYYEIKNTQEALKIIKEGLKINSKHQKALFNIGIINLSIGNNTEANKWFEKSLASNPNSEFAAQIQKLIQSHKSIN